jgi:hypothetical protein
MPPGGLGALGRTLIALGAAVALLGVVLVIADRFPGLRIGKLPGDVSIERPNFRLYFPLGTSILVSIVLSLVLWLIGRRG